MTKNHGNTVASTRTRHSWIAVCITCLALITLTACAQRDIRETLRSQATAQSTVHAFSFDGWFDKWATEVDLLEYSYGDKYHVVRDKVQPTRISLGYRANVNGAMPVGEFLYVKWRLKSTGEIVETKVDLRPLLPRNMYDQKLTFVIDGTQLYVYLVTPKFKLEWRVMPPLVQDQAKIYMRDDAPVAYVSWARFSPAVAQRFAMPPHQLTGADWRSGEENWIVDLIAPFGGAQDVMNDVRTHVFAGQEVRQLSIGVDGLPKVVTWPALASPAV
jgi:hemolysin-activating ACP:hemolysin acyltransferase